MTEPVLAGSPTPIAKTKSELLFEGYPRAHGYTNFDFEPEMPGTTKRPDYRLAAGGQNVLFEIKEFRGTPGDFSSRGGFFNPYPPLREKIEAGRKKFKDLDQHCCCLVLHNVDKPLVLLDWAHVYRSDAGEPRVLRPDPPAGRTRTRRRRDPARLHVGRQDDSRVQGGAGTRPRTQRSAPSWFCVESRWASVCSGQICADGKLTGTGPSTWKRSGQISFRHAAPTTTSDESSFESWCTRIRTPRSHSILTSFVALTTNGTAVSTAEFSGSSRERRLPPCQRHGTEQRCRSRGSSVSRRAGHRTRRTRMARTSGD